MNKMNEMNEMKVEIQKLMDNDYRNFIKALISIEKDICNPEELDTIYDNYIDNDWIELLSEDLFE